MGLQVHICGPSLFGCLLGQSFMVIYQFFWLHIQDGHCVLRLANKSIGGKHVRTL